MVQHAAAGGCISPGKQVGGQNDARAHTLQAKHFLEQRHRATATATGIKPEGQRDRGTEGQRHADGDTRREPQRQSTTHRRKPAHTQAEACINIGHVGRPV
eukprot:3461462-Rhodomonas_salina.2